MTTSLDTQNTNDKARITGSDNVPGVRGLPLLGNLLEFRRDRFNLYTRIREECGDIGEYHLGARRVVMLNAPEHIQAVLIDHDDDFEKSPASTYFLRPVLGNGLLTTDRVSHKRQRKLVVPAFQHRRIAAYGETMVEFAQRVQQTWAEGHIIDIEEAMTRLTLGIVCKALFDTDVLNQTKEIGEALTIALHHITEQITAFIPLPITWPTSSNLRFRKALTYLDATIARMIEERRSNYQDRNDLLSLLLQAKDEGDGSGLTDKQIRDEVMTLFLAGHETTAVALTWTWYLLTQHPEIYAKVLNEVDTVLKGRAPTVADLPNLPYTLQVLKEALRLYPPVHSIGRLTAVPIKLGNYSLPAGVIVGVCFYLIHRRPDYFPDPERFNPDRFTPEAEQRLPRFAYMPFSAGPRNCLGSQFAMMEGHLILATLAQHVTFKLASDAGQNIAPNPLITLRPKSSIKMIVQRRQSLAG